MGDSENKNEVEKQNEPQKTEKTAKKKFAKQNEKLEVASSEEIETIVTSLEKVQAEKMSENKKKGKASKSMKPGKKKEPSSQTEEKK